MDILKDNSFWLLILSAAVFLVVWFVIQWLRRRDRRYDVPDVNLTVDVTQLADDGPPSSGPRIEFYGTPVRVRVVVLAPVGRDGELPPADLLPGILERLIPGMSAVIASHKPTICRWPAQLSSHGFAQSFFNNVRLPGDCGKGTRWCSIAGRFQVGDRQFLAGIACSAATPNGLSQVIVQHDGIWLDILRIRE